MIFLKCGDMACLTGAADADAALQRRKERYRQELQEQIAEQQRNKKRWVSISAFDPAVQ